MSRKPNLLHVRSFISWVIDTCEDMQKRDKQTKSGQSLYKNGILLPPIDMNNLREMSFFGRMILKKHASKKTRKDIYVEKKEVTNV